MNVAWNRTHYFDRGKHQETAAFFLMMHHKAIHRNWVPAERHYRLYEHAKFPLPDNYYDAYEGRYAAQMQKMNIYRVRLSIDRCTATYV